MLSLLCQYTQKSLNASQMQITPAVSTEILVVKNNIRIEFTYMHVYNILKTLIVNTSHFQLLLSAQVRKSLKAGYIESILKYYIQCDFNKASILLY